ncbi:MFS transporter [Solidesulfovibrio carbinolicus]|nr:MFS transporter [Solidesulfovibrio carbinolicus]
MLALLAVGYAIGWSAVHSMLVKRLGIEYLPYTYIGISLLGVVGSSIYLSFADAVRRDRLLIWFCGLTGLALLASRLLVTARPDAEPNATPSLALFFAAVFFAQGVGNATLGTQVWTIVNDLLRPSQGRRIYPMLGTAGTIGGIAGGASIHFLAERFGTANLIVLWAFAILAIIPMTLFVRARFGGELRGLRPNHLAKKAHSERLGEGVRFFLSSRMARTLGVVALLFWIVGSIADFQYTRIMNNTFTDEASLAGYYGIYGMLINASGLVVQFFCSAYLIRRIGVGRGFLALPATALGGFALVGASFTFWPGLVLRYAWDMVGMTVQGNSYQLALNAIPSNLRGRMRGLLDGVINPLGGVFGGLLILGLHFFFDHRLETGWNDPVTLSGMVLTVAWIFFVLSARESYFSLLENNMKSNERRTVLDAIESLEEPGSQRAAELLDLAATSQDPEIRASVARTRGGSRDQYALAGLLQSVHDENYRVRLAAVRSLARFPAGIPGPAQTEIDRLLESDPEPQVRAAAFQALLAGHCAGEARSLADKWLGHTDPRIRAHAVEAVGRTNWDHRPLLAPLLSDPAPLVRAWAARVLLREETTREQATQVLALVLEDVAAGTDAHELALATLHGSGPMPAIQLPSHIMGSHDPAVRVLALALSLEQTDATAAKTLHEIFNILADPDNTERLRAGLVPYLPDFSERVADAILMGCAMLDPARRKLVSHLLTEWHQVLETRTQGVP